MKMVAIDNPQDLDKLMAELFGREPEETPSEKELNELLRKTLQEWITTYGDLKAEAMMAYVRAQAMAIHCGNKHKEANLGQRGEVGEGLKKLMQVVWLQLEGLTGPQIWSDEPWTEEQRESLAALGEILGTLIRDIIHLLALIDKELEDQKPQETDDGIRPSPI